MNTLTTRQELDSTRTLFRNEKLPKAALEIFDAARAELERNATASHALQAGATAPDIILPNVDGRSVRLYTELERGPVVLVFYRGGWCPFCNIHLRGFQKSLADFHAAGAQVIAISPQVPDQSFTTKEKDELAFPVLSDVGLHTAQAFGVAYELPQALLDIHRDFEVPLEDFNGTEGSTRLPMPATFVIRTDRTVAYAHIDTDFMQRADPIDVLNLVRQLKNHAART